MEASTHKQIMTALQWYSDQGADVCILDEVVNRFLPDIVPEPIKHQERPLYDNASKQSGMRDHYQQNVVEKPRYEERAPITPSIQTFLGKSDAYEESLRLAQQASTLEELRQAVAEFDGIALKKTASNLVFAVGNPKAQIMLVSEAPGADEDRSGTPFVGVSGKLLDKILACIGLDRMQDDPQKSIYISNILNWRPPGNRTPSPAEIEVSLPFIERHIQLVNPEVLILCGGVAAKALLGQEQSISRLRNSWHDYVPQTRELRGLSAAIPTIATYHPSYLLRTPAQKKLVWADMLMFESYRRANLLE